MLKIAGVTLLTFFLSACTMTMNSSPAPSSAIAELAPTGKLRAAINYGNAVLAKHHAESGEVSGVSVDLARELARRLELPSTGWIRRYRVRVHGTPDPAALAALARGVTIEGVRYGPIEASTDSRKGENAWLTVGLREGRNREVRRIMAHLGPEDSNLICGSIVNHRSIEEGKNCICLKNFIGISIEDKFRCDFLWQLNLMRDKDFEALAT